MARFFFSGPRPRIEARVDEMLDLVGLRDKADRPVKGFSGGERQRLGLALAQVNYPELLILDEPVVAMDPIGRHEVLQKILFQLGMIAIALGAILIAYDQILGERQSGATEWILSKPVSREAYILSKLVADAIGVIVILVAVQSAIAYGLIAVANGGPLPPASFLVGAGGMALHTLFYLSLTLMLGVLANNRGILLGVPMPMALGGIVTPIFLGSAVLFTPWALGQLCCRQPFSSSRCRCLPH
jgi:ABC-type Na+ efflux pump permease subunit